MDDTQRFAGKADAFAKVRPAFAPELFERIAKWAELGPQSVIACIRPPALQQVLRGRWLSTELTRQITPSSMA